MSFQNDSCMYAKYKYIYTHVYILWLLLMTVLMIVFFYVKICRICFVYVLDKE